MMSTTLPDTLKTLKRALDAVGVRLVDAPISGGIVGAEHGTLTVMMGGEDADIETVTPLMRSMGQRIFHCRLPARLPRSLQAPARRAPRPPPPPRYSGWRADDA